MTKSLSHPNMYRLDVADAVHSNPHRPRATRRAPGNVPYVVDNLWAWKRPEGFPCRRHSVFCSPTPELALAAGGAVGGRVFTVDAGNQAKLAQVRQRDARFHPEASGDANLAKLLLRLLDRGWADGPLEAKQSIAVLWAPCLERAEVERLFELPPLAAVRERMWQAIKFWDEARLVQGTEWPFPEGEVFFEAESWEFHEG